MIGKSAMSNPDFAYLPTKTIKHCLYDINRERKIAFCTACGWTEIHIPKSRTKQNPKIFCIKRFQEISEKGKKERRLNPSRRPRHILTDIDTEKMAAICSVCGAAKIQKRISKDVPYYACATRQRAYRRKYGRNYYSSRSTSPFVHVLSQVNEENKTAVCSICGPVQVYIWQGERKIGRRCENASVRRIPGAQKIRREINTIMINRHKVEHGCKRCGYNENPSLLHLYSGNPNKKEPKIEKLLRLTSKELFQELAMCEVFCANCRSFANYELVLENLRSLVDYEISSKLVDNQLVSS